MYKQIEISFVENSETESKKNIFPNSPLKNTETNLY